MSITKNKVETTMNEVI